MTMNDYRVFQFLRGAVRSAYGIEDFRHKSFLIIGMSPEGQRLLNRLCFDDVEIKFLDPKVSNYYRSFAICKDIDMYQGQKSDIVIDFANSYLSVQGQSFPINNIGEDPYNQGIHEFYR